MGANSAGAVATACLAAAVLLIAVLCYRHLAAIEQQRLRQQQARQAAAALDAGTSAIKRYRQLLQQAEQLRRSGVLGASASHGVKLLQQLAADMRDAGYRLSSLPDIAHDGAIAQQAAIEFYATVQQAPELGLFLERLSLSDAGVFIPQRCRLHAVQGALRFNCDLKWSAIREGDAHGMQ